MLDTLIRGAKIVDGTGKAAFTADVGILDGMIEAVGNLSGAQAFETIEAAGRVLTRRCFAKALARRSSARDLRRL